MCNLVQEGHGRRGRGPYQVAGVRDASRLVSPALNLICRCAEFRAHSRQRAHRIQCAGSGCRLTVPAIARCNYGSSCRGQCRRTSSRLSWRYNICRGGLPERLPLMVLIHAFSPGGTACWVSCSPIQSVSPVMSTLRPCRGTASAAAHLPSPPPMITRSAASSSASVAFTPSREDRGRGARQSGAASTSGAPTASA